MTETLEIRSRPKPVSRLNRKMVILAVLILIGLLAFLSFYALEPKAKKGEGQKELYNITHKQKAEGLAELPKSYQDIKPSFPKLGAPYMGDTGPALHAAEIDAGVDEPIATGNIQPFRPSPVEENERAERIRKARQQSLARESAVFFQTSGATVKSEAGQGAAFSYENDLVGLQQLMALGSGGPAPTTNSPSAQDRKKAFLQKPASGSVVNKYGLLGPLSPYSLMSGTIISASLITGINSDLPGQALAQVSENVYDTVTGKYLLIPQGSRLIGRYDSEISSGQQRVLVVWDRIIRPDGSSVQIDNIGGTDKAGYAGLADRFDWHTGRLLKGIGLATLLGVGTELAYGGANGSLAEAIRDSSQSNINKAGRKIIDRFLNIQPTITIRPGWPVRVIVGKDIILTPFGETS
ncbi:MAG TPA: TrbI/VirB10 family protein [Sphingomonadales bacterium]|nr:TrbI/VirB10 family protein [Sphingomonadales bacterium]